MDQVEALSPLEQGILLATLLDGRGQPLSRIANARCAAAHRALERAAPAQRHRVVARLSRRLFSPVPDHLERVHPSWIRHLLARETPDIAALVLDAIPSTVDPGIQRRPPTAAPPWLRPVLCRWVLGQLEPMPTERDPERPALADLPRLPDRRLASLLLQLGRLALEDLLQRAADPELALRAQAAEAGPELEQRLRGLALQTLAPALSPRTRRQLAQRGPREPGLALWTATGPADPRAAASAAQLLQQALCSAGDGG